MHYFSVEIIWLLLTSCMKYCMQVSLQPKPGLPRIPFCPHQHVLQNQLFCVSSLFLVFTYSGSMGPGPSVSASCGDALEMQILKLQT